MKRNLRTAEIEPEEWLLGLSIARLACSAGPALGPTRPARDLCWKRVQQLATWHRLLPLLYYVSKYDSDFPQAPFRLLQQMEQNYRWSTIQNLSLKGHLLELLASLRDEGIRAIVLKGVPLAEMLYPQLGLRPTTDIDLLVQPSDLSRAERIMKLQGFVSPLRQALRHAYRQHHHHLAPYIHERTKAIVEIHWQVVRPDCSYQLDMDRLWANAQEASIGGVPFLTLAPEDRLLHLCVHFFGDRLGAQPGALLQLCDIALLITHHGDTLRWDKLVPSALERSLSAAVYTVLHTSKLITGAFCPEWVAEALRPKDFDERRARLFATRRVIGVDQQVAKSLVLALAAPGLRRKLRELRQALRPPVSWTPGGEAPSARQSGFVSLLVCLRALGTVSKAVFQLRQVRDQVLIERWLAEQHA